MNEKGRSGFVSLSADDRISHKELRFADLKGENQAQNFHCLQLQTATFPMVLFSESCSSKPTHTEAIQQCPLIKVELSLQPPGFGLLWRSKVLSGIVFTHQIEVWSTSSTRN